LTVVGKIPLSALRPYLEKIEAISKKDNYREAFPWVDNIAPLKDPKIVSLLNQRLVSRLLAEDIDTIWLSPPEPLNWASLSGFSYSVAPQSAEPSEMDLSTYLALAAAKKPIDPESLREHTVGPVDPTTGKRSTNWSIFRCLVAELSD